MWSDKPIFKRNFRTWSIAGAFRKGPRLKFQVDALMPINVLYVDDDDDIRSIVKTTCEADPDFFVTTVASGQEALALARDKDFELVLLDVVMPGIDGPATLGLLRAQERRISTPVAFLTAHDETTERDWLQSLNVVGVLAKPFDPRTLAKRLRLLIETSTAAPALPTAIV